MTLIFDNRTKMSVKVRKIELIHVPASMIVVSRWSWGISMKMISDVTRYIRHSNDSRTRQEAAWGWYSAVEDRAMLSLKPCDDLHGEARFLHANRHTFTISLESLYLQSPSHGSCGTTIQVQLHLQCSFSNTFSICSVLVMTFVLFFIVCQWLSSSSWCSQDRNHNEK